MRRSLLTRLLLFSVFLLGACTQIKVVGEHRASLSHGDVQSITKIAQTIEPGQYSRLILNAVRPDEVWVDAVVHGGSTSYGYSAVRRGGMWKRGRYTPPPID